MTDLPTDLDAALSALSLKQNISRDDAISRILREWLFTHGYLADKDGDAGSEKAEPGKPDPEYVQYPGYFEDQGSI